MLFGMESSKKARGRNSLKMAFLCPVIFCLLLWACSEEKEDRERMNPLSPEEALESFELEPGFELELLVSEPLIMDPVDMEIDEFGRLYVVEMPGYPLNKSGTGRIKIIHDSNGDGVFDSSTLFAEDLMFPNGIMRWKNGVIVTDAPNVLYLEDRNGDGKADIRDTLLTGFSLSNPHVNVNNPVYGLDNWIYLAHMGHIGTRKYEEEFGDRGDEIRFHGVEGSPTLPKNANGLSVRFQLGPVAIEMNAGRTQFGHTFDAWGRYILTHNQNHIYQEVMRAKYVKRNPDFLLTQATASISDHGNETAIFQRTTTPDRQLFTTPGLTTASSGITAYLGGIFPAPFDSLAVFVTESAANLVHVDLLKEDGASYRASRHNPEREFLASKDSWSRPVNMYVGPDGALYVLDYYRRIIEHPEWMADEAVEAGGLYDGVDMGRIYRIVPQGTGAPEWVKGLDLGQQSPAQWVQHLASPNHWWRQHAQRLLVSGQHKEIAAQLIEMANNPQSAYGRLHALWTLDGLGLIQEEILEAALDDLLPEIRENALLLAEKYADGFPKIVDKLLLMKDDPHPRVRFQLLCTLGEWEINRAAQARDHILFMDLEDDWVQAAALSASSSPTYETLEKVLERFKKDEDALGRFTQKLVAMMVAKEAPENRERWLAMVRVNPQKSPAWKRDLIIGVAGGLRRNEAFGQYFSGHFEGLFGSFFDIQQPAIQLAMVHLLEQIPLEEFPATYTQDYLDRALDPSLPERERVMALRLLALGNMDPHVDAIKVLVDSRNPLPLQIAALQALGKSSGTQVPEFLLGLWENLTQETRDVAIGLFLKNNATMDILITAIENRQIAPELISWKRRVQLMNSTDEQLRKRAREILTMENPHEQLEEFKGALTLKGDSQSGKNLYATHCASCHQVNGGLGVSFGPDLGTVHHWLPKDLMANIVVPDLSIAPGFDLWELNLIDGRKFQGMILAETSTAISLRVSPGLEQEIMRQEIEGIKALNSSLMPPLGDEFSKQEMADLLAFLKKL
jgi:putative membrane-bound dehydrogenase-like protein